MQGISYRLVVVELFRSFLVLLCNGGLVFGGVFVEVRAWLMMKKMPSSAWNLSTRLLLSRSYI